MSKPDIQQVYDLFNRFHNEMAENTLNNHRSLKVWMDNRDRAVANVKDKMTEWGMADLIDWTESE